MIFINNSIITVFTRIFVFICAIIISIYIARVLGPEAKGIYSLLIQMISISGLIGMCGIDNAVVYYLSKNEELKKVYANLLFYVLLSGVIILFLLYSSVGFLKASFLRNIDDILVKIVIITIPFMLFTKLSISVILGLNEIKLFNAFKIISSLVMTISFFLLVMILKWNIKGAIFCTILTELFMSMCYMYVISQKIRIEINFDIGFIKKLFGYGIRGFLASLFLMVIFRIDFYLLNMFSGIRDVGFYSVSVGFGEMIFFIPEAIGVILFPKLSGMNSEERNKKTIQMLRFFSLALGIMTLFMFLFSHAMIGYIYGIQYVPSVSLMRIMLPGFFFMSFYYIYFSYFYSKGKPEIVTAALLITAIIKVVLSLILIPKFGVVGASYGTLVSYSACGFIFILAFLKYSGAKLRNVFIMTNSDMKYIFKSLELSMIKNGIPKK
jgi:O-antigen/teichoic acid export membrane protein